MEQFSVGLPCMKLSLSPSTQKHHDKKAKTCGVRDAWREMCDERRGRDTTIDREQTKDNVWLTGSTDMDMVQVVADEVSRINEERKAHGKRSLRKDAVSGIEMIEKIPMEIMQQLSKEEQLKLLQTSNDVVTELLAEWAPEWKVQAAVIHFDEFGGKSPHTHRIITTTARDDDGLLTMNAKRDFNLKFFIFLNTEYPKRMRERGVPVKDCESYEKMTEEEREVHALKKKDYGMESFEYKQKKTQELDGKIESKLHQSEKLEKQIETKSEQSVALDKQLEAKQSRMENLQENIVALSGDVDALKNDINKAKKEVDRYDFTKDELKLAEKAVVESGSMPVAAPVKQLGRETDYVKINKADWQGIKKILIKAKTKDKVIKELREEIGKLQGMVDVLRGTVERYAKFVRNMRLEEKFREFVKRLTEPKDIMLRLQRKQEEADRQNTEVKQQREEARQNEAIRKSKDMEV
jgi:hypothetical protein